MGSFRPLRVERGNHSAHDLDYRAFYSSAPTLCVVLGLLTQDASTFFPKFLCYLSLCPSHVNLSPRARNPYWVSHLRASRKLSVSGREFMRKAIWLGVLIVWFSVIVPAAMGQKLGQVEGTVEDPTGIPVAQAEVKLTGQNTGIVQKAVTDEAGHFAFIGVEAGDYGLSAKVEGVGKAELQLKGGTNPTPAQRGRPQLATVKREDTDSP